MGICIHILLPSLIKYRKDYIKMADAHKLEIFRGLVKFKSNTQKIWGVLIFLSIITAVEVVLGIYKPAWLMSTF